MIWLFSFGFHLFLHLVCCPPLLSSGRPKGGRRVVEGSPEKSRVHQRGCSRDPSSLKLLWMTNGGEMGKSVVLVCISKSKNEGRKTPRNHRFFVIARAKLCTKNAGEEWFSIGVKYLKVFCKVLLFRPLLLKVFGQFVESFESFLKVF